jgi:hypothetical protein
MFIAYAILAVLLALALAGSAFGKLSKQPKPAETFAALGVPTSLVPFLAVCELAGAAGLVIGLWWAPLGVAAAAGVVAYFIGAVGAHLRVGDLKGAPPAAVILIVAAAALALRAAGM